MKEGDAIKKLNSKKIHLYQEVSIYTFSTEISPLMWYMSVTERHMRQRSHPRYDKKNDRYLFGFYGSEERTKGGPVKTLQYGVYEVKYWIASTLESL